MAGLRDVQKGSHCHRKTWINLLLRVLQLLLPCLQHGGAQLQALRQMSTSVVEVWQPEDGEPMVPVQVEEERRKDSLPLKESSSSNAWENGRPLHFLPPAMEFRTQPLGLPRAETIYIHNPSQEFPVTLLSVFTSSRHFHMPSFHKRVIPPRGKASFKLIFLPLEEGNIENTLFINTSAHGVLSYQILGVGVHRGALKSVQRKDSLLIFPHIQSIKLTQTQEDTSNITILGLLLECSVSKNLLNKPQGSCLQSDTSLSLHINLSERGDRPGDLDKLKPYILEHILVLLKAPAPGPSSAGEPKIGIYMLNSGGKKLYIKDMQVLSKVEAGLEFNQLLLKPEAKNFTQVATVECRGSSPGQGNRCSRHISLQVLGNLTAHTFPGLQSLRRESRWDLSGLVQVRQSGRATDQLDLWLSNPFPLPLTITNPRLARSSRGVLKVVNFTSPLTVPQGCWRLLSLQLLHKALPVHLLSSLRLDSSLGAPLTIPLYLQSGLGKGEVVFEAVGECGRPCPIRLSEAGRAQWQRSLLPGSLSSWTVDSRLATELCSQWQSNKEQLPCRWPRLPLESSSTLDFGATPVNESKVKLLTLKNPSHSVVSVEISSLSQYPAPLHALDILTRWFNISPLSVNISTTEFTLLLKLPKDGEKFIRGQRVLRLLLQPWETRELAVVFTPSEHKPTSTILVIRNNLTVFDMVTVRGHGAKELLRVGGKLPGPGASLRFNVPQSTLMECRDGVRTNKPLFAIRKSFRVENAGELPLTVMSMNINGYQCQGFGFEVLQCRSFSLDHNSSSEITIAFTPDFTSSWVIRDLTLVTSRGSSFPFTLNVTLPHHMLPLCAQVVPGPSWEETFWMITLVFTCFSLFGVCLMAFHQAQYILNEFFTPSSRSNHNSVLSRHKAPVNNITPNGVRTKGGCKSYVDAGHTSDKGKGRGSAVLANANPPAPPRPQPAKKAPSPPQPPKKHRVSPVYAKPKPSGAAPAPAAAATADEEQRDLSPAPLLTPEPEVCNHNNNNVIVVGDEDDASCRSAPTEEPTHFKEEEPPRAAEDKGPEAVTFPMETPGGRPPHQAAVGAGAQAHCSPAGQSVAKQRTDGTYSERRASAELEPLPREECRAPKKKVETCETGAPSVNINNNNKGKKSRRKASEGISGVPEHSVLVMSEREKDPEWRPGEPVAGGPRARTRCPVARTEAPKPCLSNETPFKQNGVCLSSRPRRKTAAERRGPCESGSDSCSSSGSVRASRGSWGSWSSTSSVEGEKDPGARAHLPAPPARKRDSMQCNNYPAERDCYQNVNTTYKAQSMNSLYCKDQCQNAQAPCTSGFGPSFASVTAGVERNMDLTGQYVPEETWSAPSVPLTNDFRYNASDALPSVPQPPAPGPYQGFPWNSANSQCSNGPYGYCEQDSYMMGNGQNFPSNGYPCQESQGGYSQQPSWSEDCPQETPSVWDTAACVGSKPYFHGTRSLSPMSSLFGSIWTPQSDPYQSQFQADRSAPMSPVSPVAPVHVAPFSREPGGSCRLLQYSSFHPFGPHMNLDIWNSSSNRSSNSQLSNDSGYCGDV
ncbi:transmembrane protein 131-like isoform X4 [Gadus chalcogrammus]|uniref:transmembrane protein 131-like isoform X4 n=1 Tax=Gadus chalcogrammus TaxID=1042646 RepID=UPI0024C46A23|nr:transmembrane protein 131-like isoform X4 [Gadus chalcogrammus]